MPRGFAKRFFAERHAMPTKNQAAIYVGRLHFLKAMAQAGTRDALAVGRAMRALPVDYLGHKASVRGDRSACCTDLTLYRVKSPQESRAAWDYYTALGEHPGGRGVPAAILRDVIRSASSPSP